MAENCLEQPIMPTVYLPRYDICKFLKMICDRAQQQKIAKTIALIKRNTTKPVQKLKKFDS